MVVINGRSYGPHVWVSGAIHGDELNGVEIVRRVMRELDSKSLRGAVIAVPIVNPLGFMIESRYLPDRRDLNRSFPGSKRGSTASRLAHLFMEEIVDQCSVGIDLHTATNHRINAPQIQGGSRRPRDAEAGQSFRRPVQYSRQDSETGRYVRPPRSVARRSFCTRPDRPIGSTRTPSRLEWSA